jgi:protocatechuate 3,4-dioxygenase beta subunit
MRFVKIVAICLLLATACAAVIEHQIVRSESPKHLRGTVTDWTGAPIPDTQVEVYDNPQVWDDDSLSLVQKRSKQKKIASAVADGRGRYSITGIPSGQYEVQFSRMGWNILSVLLKADRRRAKGLCVELEISGGAGQGQIKDCK